MKKRFCLIFCVIFVMAGCRQTQTPPVTEDGSDSSGSEAPAQSNTDEPGDWVVDWESIDEAEREYQKKMDVLKQLYQVEEVPESLLETPYHSYVTAGGGTHLRSGPDTSYAIVYTAKYNHTVSIYAFSYHLGDIGNWAFIQCNGVYGWTETENISIREVLK